MDLDRARIPALVSAAAGSVATLISQLEQWDGRQLITIATLIAWLILVATAAGGPILDAITGFRAEVAALRAEVTALRADIEAYGDARQTDGIIDGYHRAAAPAASAPPHLTSVR